MFDITIVLPTLNEVQSIRDTIERIQAVCEEDILVIDGGSTDGTVQLAQSYYNVVVHPDNGKGKGAALRIAFRLCAPDSVIFLDVDGTYEIEKFPQLIVALNQGYDVVIGNRNYTQDAEPHILGMGLFKLGDYMWSLAFKLLYGKYIDNLTGYRGLSRYAIDQMGLQEDGWGIETEISCKTIQGQYVCHTIDTDYSKRKGDTKLGLNVFDSNWRDIVRAMFKYKNW